MDKNFLNNQNYILGQTEKKKLLSKFFVDNFLLSLFIIINNIKNRIDFVTLWLCIIPFTIIFPILVIYFNINPFIFSFLYLVWIFILSIIFSKEKYKEKITNIYFKKFFISDKVNLFTLLTLSSLILVWLIVFSSKTLNYPSYYLYWLFLVIILWIFFYKKVLLLLKINIIQIIFIPFYIIFLLAKIIYSFIYVFIIKWIKWYSFIKNIPNTKFLNKFDELDKYSAENEYYKIKVKG